MLDYYMMANCIVPGCHCTHYQQTNHEKGKILAYRPDCGCGHKKILHRLPTGTDTLILKELMVADSVPCCGLIPMSELPNSTHFNSYDLIPIPPDEVDSSSCKPGQVLCLCKGYCSDKASILQQFTHTSLSDIQVSLPSVPCTRCKHPLLTHQRNHPSHQLSNQRLLDLKSSVSIKGITLSSPGLIRFIDGCQDNSIVMVTLVRCNSTYKLISREKVFSQIGVGVKRRRSERRGGQSSNEQDDMERDSLTHQLIKFLNSSLEDTATAITLNDELSSVEPTSLSSCWYIPSDSAPQLLVAIGTTQNQVIIYNTTQPDNYQIISTVNPVTMIHYCTITNSLPLLCVGDCTGRIQCWEISFDKSFKEDIATTCTDSSSPVTNILWIRNKNYIVTGNERGEVYLFNLSSLHHNGGNTDLKDTSSCTTNNCTTKNDTVTNNSSNSLTLCQKLQICSSSCTVFHWLDDKQCLLVGSADNDIHVLTMTSSVNHSTDSILNYFPPVRTDKFHYCAVMKGHQSFISGITCYHGNILSIGWDGYIMILSSTDIDRTVQTGGGWRGGEGQLVELEPSLVYKLGTQEYMVHVPAGVWNVFDRGLLIAYQSYNRELAVSLY